MINIQHNIFTRRKIILKYKYHSAIMQWLVNVNNSAPDFLWILEYKMMITRTLVTIMNTSIITLVACNW